MELVLFDLDNTLLAGDSDYAWAKYLIAQGIVDGPSWLEKNEIFYGQYTAGTLNINEYLQFQANILAGRDLEEIHGWRKRYMADIIETMLLPAAHALIAKHRAQTPQAKFAIITATNEFVTEPIAAAFGIEKLIACELEQAEDGRYTGKGRGIPSFQAGKITRLEAWLAESGQRLNDFSKSWFYSDSHNDLPLMRRVTNPVAVDADAKLTAVATELGWPQISLR